LKANTLIESLEKDGYSYYCYFTPIDCQNRLIGILEKEIQDVGIARNKEELCALNVDNFNVIIIQNTSQIICQLDISIIERLVNNVKPVLLFFNENPCTEMNGDKYDDWCMILKNSPNLIKITDISECLGEPICAAHSKKNFIIRFVSELQLRIKILMNPPWSVNKIIVDFIILLLIMSIPISIISDGKIFPLIGTAVIVSPISIALLYFIIDEYRRLIKDSWIKFVFFILSLLNLLFGPRIIDYIIYIYSFLLSLIKLK